MVYEYDIPRDYLDKARTCLSQSEECLKRFDYSTCIERTAEGIELSLKAAMTLVGKRYTREHVMAGDLERAHDEFPEWFADKLPRFALISKTTSFLYLFAKYGYEAMQAPAKKLFSDHEAKAYIEGAREVIMDCERLFYETKNKQE